MIACFDIYRGASDAGCPNVKRTVWKSFHEQFVCHWLFTLIYRLSLTMNMSHCSVLAICMKRILRHLIEIGLFTLNLTVLFNSNELLCPLRLFYFSSNAEVLVIYIYLFDAPVGRTAINYGLDSLRFFLDDIS